MLRRLLLVSSVALVSAAPALGDLSSRKHAVDTRLDRLQSQIAAAKSTETALSAGISRTTGKIRILEGQVGDVSSQLVLLERDLALHRERLAGLRQLYRFQSSRYAHLRRDYRVARTRFDRRLVAIYQQDTIGTLDILVSATSFSDLLERLDFSRDIGSQDERIAGEIGNAKGEVRRARDRTKRTKAAVASATRVIAVRTGQVRSARDRLLARQANLAAARSEKQRAFSSVHENAREAASEAAALQSVSAQLAAQIQTAQAKAAAQAAEVARAAEAARSSQLASAEAPTPAPSAPVADPTPSSSGLVWPVSGPVVSPFGMRWGRMHEGIDIAVPSGTPIHAAASGIVVYAGWMGGYGNLIAIQHSGSLATAYAHQSSFAVGSGANVAQGQVIGYVGCTGHCFGPHLHFEVRVNGSAVDPLGYL